MVGYVIPLAKNESPGKCGYPFIKENRDRWVEFNFEESSIDIGIGSTPRLVVDDIVYDVHHQYFVKEGSETLRILVLTPCKSDCEQMKETTSSTPNTDSDNQGVTNNTSGSESVDQTPEGSDSTNTGDDTGSTDPEPEVGNEDEPTTGDDETGEPTE